MVQTASAHKKCLTFVWELGFSSSEDKLEAAIRILKCGSTTAHAFQ